MTAVEISGLTKRYGDTLAIDDINVSLDEGEMLILLGPSGCGKTTILRSTAGLIRPSDGRIRLGSATVFDRGRRIDVNPRERDLGMVFQSYALWPHLPVADNIEFPLRARKVPRKDRQSAVREMARLVECEHLLDRYPGELSGGQQQRIALARALVARPRVLLFDEPLSNLDARLRADMRSMIRSLHRELGFTGIYVTHDQTEGLTIGDRIAIMNAGRIVQLGSPGEVFASPATEWAADFMGITNWVRVPDAEMTFTEPIRRGPAVSASIGDWRVGVRPGDVRIGRSDGLANDASVGLVICGAEVADRSFSGESVAFEFVVDGRRFVSSRPADAVDAKCTRVGDRVALVVDRASMYVFKAGETS